MAARFRGFAALYASTGGLGAEVNLAGAVVHIETSAGLTRQFLMLLRNAYDEEKVD